MRKLFAATLLALTACGGEAVAPDPTGSVTPTQPSADCSRSTALTLAVGDVRALTASQKASLCVAGGTGSEYVLVPVYTLGAADSKLALTFAGTNTAAASTSLDLAAAGAANLSLGVAGDAGPAFVRNAAFDQRLRSTERTLFASRASGARAAFDAAHVGSSATGARLSVAAATLPRVGDLLTFNTNATDACTNPAPRGGRVVAITQSAIVVADTGNPTGGFTDAEYQSLGQAFDTLAYPVDTLNFGKPADIDGNGDRAVIFFTKAVNDLTPANSQTYVGGFFFGRDLYPKANSGNLQGCAGSNYGEMFYMLVPDAARAAGKSNSPFTKASVQSLTVSVLAHEFQHLINESRRLYVTKTAADEETWLNEGLSHIAEELAFYRAGGLAPRQNIDVATLRNTSNGIEAFNQFESSNISRVLGYLGATETNSPIADNDSIETRGATWQLLRYSADRKGGTQRDTWHALVNSTTAGLPNLVNVFGSAAFGGTRPWLRDWAVSNYTDDAGFAVDATYQQPSWNLRSLVPALSGHPAYPLITHQLAAGTPVTLTLSGGAGAGYVRFGVAANSTGSVVTTTGSGALPAGLDEVLVRTR